MKMPQWNLEKRVGFKQNDKGLFQVCSLKSAASFNF